MILMKIPFRFRWLVYSLALSIFLIAFEIALVSRAPIWDLPWRRMAYGALAFSLVSVPLMVWLLSLQRWVWYLAASLGFLWIFFSFGLSLRMGFPNLTFFSVFLSLLLLCQLFLISREMDQSFLNPGVSWFQGSPEFIPSLRAQITVQGIEDALEVRASRFDDHGVFLFPVSSTDEVKKKIQALSKVEECQVHLQFRQSELSCRAQPIAFLPRAFGLGLQWRGVDWDLRKDLVDFQEGLRGEGYV